VLVRAQTLNVIDALFREMFDVKLPLKHDSDSYYMTLTDASAR